MAFIRFSFGAAFLVIVTACSKTDIRRTETSAKPPIVAYSFAYPISRKETVTQAKDSDEWYNALDFGADNHLGEDWNKNTGGNTDCGEPVYSTASGDITYAADAGPGWGNVVIVTHSLADGTKVQSLYGHLQEITKTSGEIKKREQIGKVGNANGKYLCHLHFEIRDESCPSWNLVFAGYSPIRYGWLDPSNFIDSHR
ncbi:MAG: M23 family metallopeptidase [Pyrinomonadaceae bacterium]